MPGSGVEHQGRTRARGDLGDERGGGRVHPAESTTFDGRRGQAHSRRSGGRSSFLCRAGRGVLEPALPLAVSLDARPPSGRGSGPGSLSQGVLEPESFSRRDELPGLVVPHRSQRLRQSASHASTARNTVARRPSRPRPRPRRASPEPRGAGQPCRGAGRLPTDFRAALLLRVEEGLSFRQIAEVLATTEETARWRVFKARQKLLAQLQSQREREES